MVRQLSATFFAAIAVALVACESTPATPQLALTSSLIAQSVPSDGYTACPNVGPFIDVGKFKNPTLDGTEVVVEGEDVNGSPLDITCSVIPDGANFKVDVAAKISGGEGGTVRVQGTFSASGDQKDVTAIFQGADIGLFRAEGCTVSYYSETEDQSKASFRGVAAGRVWGFLKCDAAENVSSLKACKATAQFRFENCAKE